MIRHDLQHTGRSPSTGIQKPALKWKFETGASVHSCPAVGADGTIYAAARDKKSYAFHPDGNLKWIFETGDAIESSPAIDADGTIYLGSNDGNLYAIGETISDTSR